MSKLKYSLLKAKELYSCDIFQFTSCWVLPGGGIQLKALFEGKAFFKKKKKGEIVRHKGMGSVFKFMVHLFEIAKYDICLDKSTCNMLIPIHAVFALDRVCLQKVNEVAIVFPWFCFCIFEMAHM